MTDYSDRIKRGADWLDADYGPSWVEDIDLGYLALSSVSNCILGQLFNSFRNVVSCDRSTDPDDSAGYELSRRDAWGMGFSLDYEIDDLNIEHVGSSTDYRELTNQWHQFISYRRRSNA